MQTPLQRIRFGRCEARPLERQILVDGVPAPVGSRAFDVLMALLDRHGSLVTKNDLLDLVWPGLVVEENNLSVHISALRKLLGAQAIATVPGRGYRFTMPLADANPTCPASTPAAPEVIQSANGGVSRASQPAHAATELLGRHSDLRALAALVGTRPLVSIVGAGGVGKTSLARRLIEDHAGRWPDGVHWIELAPLQDGSQIAFRVAQSLGVELATTGHAQESLIAALTQARALIVLDNCEHLLEPVTALVSDALGRATEVRWLVTSQEPFRLPAEIVYRLDTLAVPPPGLSVAEASGFPAVALLTQRAASADRRFTLSDGNIDIAIDLVRRLDGLPLAIEMAAARVATLGLQGVRERLDQRLRILAGARSAPLQQQTLRAALDWSHGLLSADEQRVFRRLAPFAGGFTAEMAQGVGCDIGAGPGGLDEWATLECLSALVDKSLVQASAADPPRYHLLESARDYAREKLAEVGESDMARRRHARAMAAQFQLARVDADRLRDEQWLARYLPERDNLRDALGWACQADEPDTLAALVAGLQQVDYFVNGPCSILEFAVPGELLSRAAPAVRGAACVEFGWAEYLSGSRLRAAELSRQALEAFEQVGERAGVYRSLAQLVRICKVTDGLQDDAEAMWERVQRFDDSELPARVRMFCLIALRMGNRRRHPVLEWPEMMAENQRLGFGTMASICRINQTDHLLVAGRFAEVARVAQQYIDAGEARPRARAFILANQAEASMQLGQVDAALESVRGAMRAYPDAMYLVADTLALGAFRQGRAEDAAMLMGYIEAVRRDRSQIPDPAEAKVHAEIGARLREALPADVLEHLQRSGAGMSGSALFELAMRR
jgi:predicted ATPase/DNA-binding winged helix-turn-helix (wHTH) protein